ncbi:MAG: carbohydrate kinase, partial [Armatimonadetes bacterium]|nr:carbohydrate kinase [Armatimonadota bacterium]
MTPERLDALLNGFASIRVGVLGDFFVDQYLMIDPGLEEVSIETGLPAHQVIGVRSQPGAAGTITNNLAALGVGSIVALGFSGLDGPGFELRRALREAGVRIDYLPEVARHTPTYTKPLVLEPGRPPRELSRLDLKNRDATPPEVEEQLLAALWEAAAELDALIVLDQVEDRNTGVVTDQVRDAVAALARSRPELVVLADSRRHIALFSEVMLKPNVHELGAALGLDLGPDPELDEVAEQAMQLARRQRQPVFVTLGERGVLAAEEGVVHHVAGVE